MANITITALPTAGAITGAELVPIVQNGVTVQTTAAAISASPPQFQPFLTIGQQTTLPNSRAISAGTGLTIADGGAQNALTLSATGALLSLINSGTGIQVKTGASTVTNVQIAVGTGLTISSPDGLAGNPTIGLATVLQNIVATAGTGLLSIIGPVVSATSISGTNNQITVTNGATTPIISLATNPVLPGIASVTVPVGATSARPGMSSIGMLRYNSDLSVFEGYTATGWSPFAVSTGVLTAFNIAGGLANQIPYQTAPSTTSFLPAPTIASTFLEWNGSAFVWATAGGSGMVYPSAGIPLSTGSAWGTSYATTGTGTVVLNTSPTLVTPALGTPSAVVLTNATGTATALTAGSLVAGQTNIIFTPQAGAPTATRGAVWYDSTLDALAYNNSLGEVALGQQVLLQYCYNNTGTTIAIGAAVYINGQFGTSPSVALATAAAIGTSNCIGLAVVAIPTGAYGYVINQGVIANLNTSGFTAGQTLYLSAATPGALVNTIPGTQFYNYRLGICTVSNATTGQIFVDIATAYVLPTAIVSPITFTAQSTTYNPLQIYGYSSGQIADLFDVWTYSGGTKALSVANTGAVTIPTLSTAQLTSTATTGTAPLVVASTTPVANLSIGGNAATATSISGGATNQIIYQAAASTNGFITAPTTSSTFLEWNGAAFVWATAGIPSQTGNTNKFLETNGTTTNWGFPYGIRTVNSTGTTLTDNAYHAFLNNNSYTLPDLTTVNDGFGLMSLSNSASVPSSVITSDGWTISTGMTAGTLRAISPFSKATAHGTWGALPVTPPIIATVTAVAAPTIIGTTLITTGFVAILYAANSVAYVVILNTNTGAFGTPVAVPSSLYSVAVNYTIFTDTSSTFVVSYINNTTTFQAIVAASISGTTITYGSPVSAAVGLTPHDSPMIQLQSGSYCMIRYGTGYAFQVSGIVATVASTNIIGASTYMLAARVSNSTILLAGVTTTNNQPIVAQVITVTGTTITFGTPVNGATSNMANALPGLLKSFSPGGPYLFCSADGTTPTTGNYYGISVSGTVPTIGAVVSLTNNLPTFVPQPNYQYDPANDQSAQALAYNSTTMLLGHLATGPFAITISGTTLTVGSQLSLTGTTTFVTDAMTGLNLYAVTSSTFSNITVSGTTITSVYKIAVSPVVIGSTTLTDKAVNYSSTWYSWSLPTMSCAATPNNWLSVSGNTINLYGPIS